MRSWLLRISASAEAISCRKDASFRAFDPVVNSSGGVNLYAFRQRVSREMAYAQALFSPIRERRYKAADSFLFRLRQLAYAPPTDR